MFWVEHPLQTDYIFNNHKLSKFFKSVKRYPEVDISSGHNPLVISLKIRRLIKTPKELQPEKIRDKKIERLLH